MESKLEREVRFLRRYAVVATLVCGLLLLTAFTIQNRKQKFEEIDVERLNVVEKDGALRLVWSSWRMAKAGPESNWVSPLTALHASTFWTKRVRSLTQSPR